MAEIELDKLKSNIRLRKIILFSIIVLGIGIRFYFQFLTPSFNVDEIALGTSIVNSPFSELFDPFPNHQSAPPLFLLVQKLATYLISPLWVNLKILSFIFSSVSIILFFKLIKQRHFLFIVVCLSVFSFNPFIIYNSLTLKQYVFDLFFILILLNSYNRNRIFLGLFFIVFILTSNIGLFACVGYLFFDLFNYWKANKPVPFFGKFISFVKKDIAIILAPLPYLIYFIYWINQPLGLEMKAYMIHYWRDSFIPLNLGFFKFSVNFIHGLYIYFLNGYELIGMTLFLFLLLGIYNLVRKQLPVLILFSYVFFIHIMFNMFKLYPLSDRLYLYLAPFIILLTANGIDEFFTFLENRIKFQKSLGWISLLLFLIISYFSYLPYKENDIVSLRILVNKLEENHNNLVYASPRAKQDIDAFDRFTAFYFSDKIPIKFLVMDSTTSQSQILVSRAHHKFGPKEKTAQEEIIIQDLIASKKIKQINKVDGYNIYLIL